MAKKKIDPLNRKAYGAVSAALTVADIPAAASFYQKAFGFTKRGIMKGPDGKPMHAELTLRGTTLMLGPESPEMGRRSAKSVGASPASLYIYVENVDKIVDKAIKLGATSQGPVMDMFWGDRCGTIVDPDGAAHERRDHRSTIGSALGSRGVTLIPGAGAKHENTAISPGARVGISVWAYPRRILLSWIPSPGPCL
jgi:PhnB protein